MEDESLDFMSNALEELDELFEDEDLFQDLEDLGKVLDELSEEGEDFDLSQELETKDSTAVKSETVAKGTSLVKKKKDVASSSGNGTKKDESLESSVKLKSSNEEELEEGEILEADERSELKELHKRKAVIVNKMKKLVRHKMQLTTQRNELLLQLQNNTQLDKVNTLLKENSLLVKAISNQIFRMNPEIKVINGKIKELVASIGSETYDEDENSELSTAKVSASRKDIENIENFFDKLSGVIKNKKDKMAEGNIDKNSGNSLNSKVSVDSAESKQVSPFYLSRTSVKAVPDPPLKNSEGEPGLGPKKMGRLTSDNSKIKKIFERVCEMTEKEQKSSASPIENAVNSQEKKISSSFESRESEKSSSNVNADFSVARTIDMKLKEIRMSGFSQKTQSDVNVIGLVDGSPSKAKQVPGKLLGMSDTGNISPNSIEKHGKKRKHFSEADSDSLNSCNVKKNKTFENTVACSISKSLLQRLGSTSSEGSIQGSSVNNDNAKDKESEKFSSDVSQDTREVHQKRNSYWCQYCRCVCNSTTVYITHLESRKHLRNVVAMQFDARVTKATKGDAVAAEATGNTDYIDAWCKGTSKVLDKKSDVGANSGSEEELCIAVTGTDEFCNKKTIGFSHSRCFAHAKCLIRSKDIPVNYSPNLCSVCLEYVRHSHSSLKCCERIFRIFKCFRKRFGLSFDWENNLLKDWFFDNYRKLQGVSSENVVDASGKSATVSYEDFAVEQKLTSCETKQREDGEGVTSRKCLAKKDASTCTNDIKESSGDS